MSKLFNILLHRVFPTCAGPSTGEYSSNLLQLLLIVLHFLREILHNFFNDNISCRIEFACNAGNINRNRLVVPLLRHNTVLNVTTQSASFLYAAGPYHLNLLILTTNIGRALDLRFISHGF